MVLRLMETSGLPEASEIFSLQQEKTSVPLQDAVHWSFDSA